MTIKDKVQELARQKKMTIAEVERNTGIANGTIGKWNRQNPSLETLQKIANYFNVSTDYLLGRTDNPKVNNGVSSNNDEDDMLIAAHIREGLSEEEKEEVMQYIEFLKSKHTNK
jgi:transcriptional regulator with XRE-family HTH domain